MFEPGVFRVASKDIVFESFDGESVVLDLGTGKYYGFSDSASCVWDALSTGVPISALAGVPTAAAPLSAADLDGFAARLIEYNLLVPAEALAATLPDDISGRLSGAREPLRVDVYDDLADLVLVDPIHDVNEPAGWPVRKAAT